MKIFSGVLGAFSVLLAGYATPVNAAPQILAVLSSLGPQQMQCGEANCMTTLTTYCLQQDRDVPTTGHVYGPAHADQFALIVTTTSGEKIELAVADNVEFRSMRGFTSVRVVISAQTIQTYDIASAEITAHPGASLLPAPVAGDPNPITAEEIAYATRSLRDHGEEIVDATPDAQAAALINRVAATIVPRNRATDENLEQLWHNVIDGLGPAKPAGQDAIRRARDIYDWCQSRMSYHSMSGVKSCLEFKHDDTIMRLNTDYWNSQPSH